MKIRNAQNQDLENIAILNKIDDYGNPDDFIEDHIVKGQILVVELDDEIIGFALYQLIWGNTPFYSLVKVHPSYQRLGVGRKLTQELESIIRNKGFDFYCSSTTCVNMGAKEFHLKLGFTEVGVLNLPHGKEVFYRKDL